MVLTYLNVPITYDRLAKLLRSEWYGTPFGNVQYLRVLGLAVTMDYHGTLDLFERTIEMGLPVVVNVKTIDWDHWQDEETYHAVVVVGLDRTNEIIYIHDPFFTTAPIELSLNKFLIGWEEQERQYAVIGPTAFQ